MTRESFLAAREPAWQRLEAIVATLERGRRHDGTGELPALYRRACQDLALVRTRRYGQDVEQRLQPLVLRGHGQLYRGRPLGRGAVGRFFAVDFPRLVRAEARLVLLCTALLVVPMLAMAGAVRARGELVYSLLPNAQVQELESMYTQARSEERSSDSGLLMFGFYIENNVGIAFRTFATGIFLGIGAALTLVLNGLFFGAVAGHLMNAGLADTFFPFVVGHGAFELTAIVLAGVAGVRLGLSLLAPGARTRARALREEGRRLVPMVWGIAVMLVVAAFVEAFWSPRQTPAELRYAVAVVLWTGVVAYFTFAGRGERGVAT